MVIGAWLQAHPRDAARRHRPPTPHVVPGPWCARSVANVRLRDEREWIRHAYFQAPRLQPGATLPSADDTAARALRRCELGAVAIELLLPYPEAGVALVESLSLELDKHFGTPAQRFTDAQLFSGTQQWPATARQSRAPRLWQRGRVTIFMAYLAVGAMGEVVIAAWDSIADLAVRPEHLEVEPWPDATDPVRRRSLERWIAQADRPREAVSLRGILPGVDRWQRDSTVVLSDSILADALIPWLRGAAQLEPARRAATLMAAHDILEIAEGPYRLWAVAAAASRQRLDSVAIGFRSVLDDVDASTGAATYVEYYDGDLLSAAAQADSAGPVGDEALIQLVERGFAKCGGSFRRVIAVGEPLLARIREPAAAARIHLAVANAYRDIVKRSYHGVWYDETPRARYAAEAADARVRAVEHYRQALAGGVTSAAAREGGREASRLVAGLEPLHDGSFCPDVD